MNTLNYTAAMPSRSHQLALIFIAVMTLLTIGNTVAQSKNQVVRIAHLRIDSVLLEKYRVELQEEIETSMRVEPGVLTLYAVEEKKRPGYITVFEIYANDAAYQAHVQSPHFKKYKNSTKDMVKSLELIETTPIALEAKPRK